MTASYSSVRRFAVLAASLLVLAGCAQSGVRPAAETPRADAVINGLTQEDRAAFFVNHARNGECAEVAKSIADGQPVDQFDSLGQTALIAAVSHNSLECARILLDHQASVNLADGSGWSPLIYAAYFGDSAELLTELLKHGADINARNDRGITALFLASAVGHEEQVKFLLGHGADRSIESTAGYTPLRIAKLRGQGRIVALLESAAAPSGAPSH